MRLDVCGFHLRFRQVQSSLPFTSSSRFLGGGVWQAGVPLESWRGQAEGKTWRRAGSGIRHRPIIMFGSHGDGGQGEDTHTHTSVLKTIGSHRLTAKDHIKAQIQACGRWNGWTGAILGCRKKVTVSHTHVHTQTHHYILMNIVFIEEERVQTVSEREKKR